MLVDIAHDTVKAPAISNIQTEAHARYPVLLFIQFMMLSSLEVT